jgi:hypothetical protein
MNRARKKIVILSGVLGSLYLLGFSLLFPLFAHFVAGSTYHMFVAGPARSIHEVVYALTIRLLGPDSAYTRIWISNVDWWCNNLYGESCISE